MAIDSLSSMYMNNIKLQSDNMSASAAAGKAKSAVKGISEDSSEEELESAVKSFESYFVEQILKEMKESINNINGEDEDSSTSMMTDMYMDSTIQQIAADMVEKYGDTMTDSLVAQLKRNYGMTDKAESDAAQPVAAEASEKADTLSDMSKE